MNKTTISHARKYCNKYVFIKGSTLYYSFMFLKEDQRNAVSALVAFYKKIYEISRNKKDSNINLIKLNWWKKEVNNIYHGVPSHPIAISIRITLQDFKVEMKLLLNIIKGAYLNLSQNSYNSFADLSRLFYYNGISLGLTFIRVLYCQGKNYINFVINIAKFIHVTKIIKNLGQDLRNKKLYIAQEYLDKFNIFADDILNLNSSINLKSLLSYLYLKAMHYFERGISCINIRDKKISSIIILVNIYFESLNEIKESSFEVLNQKIEITPIKKALVLYKYK